MKPRHAAMLALVGCYLMIPRQDPKDHAFQYHANLSTWRILNSFDTASECEKTRASYLKDVQNMMKKGEKFNYQHPASPATIRASKEIRGDPWTTLFLALRAGGVG